MQKFTISPELLPVLQQLQQEGFDVYAYETDWYGGEINSLYWFENGRVLNIQPSSWRNQRYARDRFNIGVSYVPSRENGSGCGLSGDNTGTPAADLLRYRKHPTWVKGATNYRDMQHFLKRDLKFRKFTSAGTFEE